MFNKKFFEAIKDNKEKEILENSYSNNLEFKSYINKLNKFNYDFAKINELKNLLLEYLYSFNLCKNVDSECRQTYKFFRKKINFSKYGVTTIELKRCIHPIYNENFILSSFIERSFPKNWIINKELDFNINLSNTKQKTISFNDNFKKNPKDSLVENIYFYSQNKEVYSKKAAVITCIYLIKKKKIKVAFIDERTLIMNIKNTWKTNSNDLFKKYFEIDLLVIDNFGMGNCSSSIRDDFLFPLFSKRFNENKITFIISPYKMDELEHVFRFSNTKLEVLRSSSFVEVIKDNMKNK